MDAKLDYLVMDDTANTIDFDELAMFEASLDSKTKREIERESAKILAAIKSLAA